MYQVNRLFYQQNICRHFFQNVHNRKPVKMLYPLESRSLLKISGNDAPIFLQGLITNDMQHFEEGASSMYAMFLNNKGRVLYDTLIHKAEGNDSFFLECDKMILSLLQKHLKIYKLKRNVDIGDVGGDFKVFALVAPTENVADTTAKTTTNINIYKDPRLSDLGHRIIVSAKANESYVQETLGDDTVIAKDEAGYKLLRYKLGVSEGAEDLPPGLCFPLEANCDYLHGVSFHKGCYIGQEVTARVHHTGVVRKRIMPFTFIDIVDGEIERDSVILADDKKSNVGKFKSWFDGYGLGLIRIKEALEAKVLKIGKYPIQVVRPSWWPMEAPKEKAAKLE